MNKNARRHNTTAGFTLVELMVAASLGVGLALVAGDFMVSHIKSQARRESLQRQRDDWKRATSFMESEIAMSSRIFTGSEAISIPAQCDLQPSEIKLALDLPRNLPLILYGIRKLDGTESNVDRSQWIGEGQDSANFGLLIRCGPSLRITNHTSFNGKGFEDYDDDTPPIQNVLLDGIDTNASGEGLHVKVHDAKSASFSLALRSRSNSKAEAIPTYFNMGLGSGTTSRINPIASFPEESSACNKLCATDPDTGLPGCKDIGSYYVIPVTTASFNVPYEGLTENDNITVCTLVNSTSITGGIRNDVIDGLKPDPLPPTEQPGVTINGGDGRNILLGTNGPDSLNGGNGDDIIVGRGGADNINGGGGNNSYSPWPSLTDPSLNNLASTLTSTVSGGSGLDIIYLRGNKSEFSSISTCNKASGCSISPKNTDIKVSLTIAGGIDVLVFKDARVDLP